jgi:hypothetical protein
MKINLSIILLLILVSSFKNETCLQGYYIDKWFYRPDKIDSVNFQIVPNSEDEIVDDDNNYNFVIYDSVIPNRKIVSYSLYKLTRANVLDSFKSVHFYDKNGLNYKDQLLERESYKQSSGCFKFENKHSEVWYRYAEVFYRYDKIGNVIEQKLCISNDFQIDTFYSFYEYTYDDRSRILTSKYFGKDTVYSSFKYIYRDNYKMIEEFYGEKRRKVKTEKFYENGRLTKELIEFNYWQDPYFYENVYKYDAKGCKESMITYLTRDTIKNKNIRNRKYYYK